MGSWQRTLIKDGLGTPTISTTGAATALLTEFWRTAVVYVYVHSVGGTTVTFRPNVQVSPNAMTGTPPQFHANARWGIALHGATYVGNATGLRTIEVPEPKLAEFTRIGWQVAGANPRIRAGIWAGFRS